jgi:ribonuclease P/MRP protein subunit RPP1
MKITDACVHPRPSGDSSVRRMALEAHELGFDSLIAIDTPACEYGGVEVFSGVEIPLAPTQQEVTSTVKHSRETGAFVLVQAGDNGRNRMVLGMRGVHVLAGIHDTDRYAFDHVTAKMAADNGVAIDISLAPLISEREVPRQRVLDRYYDLMLLYRRFEFPLVISSHARSILEMRSVREFSALASVIGLDIPDVEKALAYTGGIQSPHSPVRVIQ